MKYCILISGLCVGWMIGMSVSPVIPGVITSILALLITVISLLGGFYLKKGEESSKLEFLKKTNLSLLPATVLVVSITIGAILGIVTRTSNVLNLNKKDNLDSTIQIEIHTYTKYGLDTEYVVKRILDSKYPVIAKNMDKSNQLNTDSDNEKSRASSSEAVLHSYRVTSSECKQLCMKDTNDIIGAIKISDNPLINSLQYITNKNEIVRIIHKICNCDSSSH